MITGSPDPTLTAFPSLLRRDVWDCRGGGGRLDASGKAGDTLMIYLSDHGAQFSRGKTTA